MHDNTNIVNADNFTILFGIDTEHVAGSMWNDLFIPSSYSVLMIAVTSNTVSVLDGDEVPAGVLLQPKVEAEIAFVMARTPDANRLTTAEIINSVAYALPAIEIVDSRIANWDIKIVDTIADNASSGLFVLGTSPRKIAELDLRLCGMVMEVNGDQVSFGAGAACLGNPLHALGWLAKTMADNGAPLKEGDVVLSGALGPMVGVSGGDYVEARIEGLGAVRVSFAG